MAALELRNPHVAPRFIRISSAPAYLGMGRDEFNRTVRPYVREFRIGQRGVGFDRAELDSWADRYVEQAAIDKAHRSGQQSTGSERQNGETSWRGKQSRASFKGKASGTSTRGSTENEFAKALELVIGRKPRGI